MAQDGELRRVEVRSIRPEETRRWADCLEGHHYLGYRGIAGKALRYVATLDGEWVALLGWGSAAFRCRARDRYIGWDEETREKRLHLVTNNVRFLVLPNGRIRNLASKVLSLNLGRLAADHQKIHGHPVVLAETFVDVSRYCGTCYRAANWQEVGLSRGYAKRGGSWRYHGQQKAVYVYRLCGDACELLRGTLLPADFTVFDRGGEHGDDEGVSDRGTDGADTRGAGPAQATWGTPSERGGARDRRVCGVVRSEELSSDCRLGDGFTATGSAALREPT